MAGFTGIAPVKWFEKYVYVPIQAIVDCQPRSVVLSGRWFARMLFTTKQPGFEPDGFVYPDGSDVPSQSLVLLSSPIPASSVLNPNSELYRYSPANLSDKFPSKSIDSPITKT